MRDLFPEFYQPTEPEFESLWRDATIVLDTNVLLEPYGLPKDGREALLGLLAELRERIWIPHQVALEFQKNRLRAIASERDRTNKALESTKGKINAIIEQINDLELGKRGIGVDPDAVIDSLKKTLDLTCEALKKAHQAQLTITVTDPIRDRLDAILDGRIGKAFPDQSAIDEICKDGSTRYANKIPPGFEDESKDDDRYPHAGLMYPSKYGDLLLWRQLLSHAKESAIEKLIFVTLEKKSDWWRIREKSIVGPHPELLRELATKGGVSSGWIVRLPDFMNQINIHLDQRISAEAINQVEASDASRPEDARFLSSSSLLIKPASFSMQSVRLWLKSIGYTTISAPAAYPCDFVGVRDGEEYGIEVIAIAEHMLSSYHRAALLTKIAIAESALPNYGITRLMFIILLPPGVDTDPDEQYLLHAKTLRKEIISFVSNPIHTEVVIATLAGETLTFLY